MLEPWAFRHRWWKKWPYFHVREKKFLMEAAALFVASTMEKGHLLKILPHPRVEVLPLGCREVRLPDEVRARIALGWSPDEPVMVFLSRVDPKKGLHMLLEALALCGSDFRGWRLVVVGDGHPGYLATLRRQAERLEESLPKVEWVGSIWNDQRWMYLQAASMFCLPTHSENFGIAVLEALHCGTPVLTTSATPWVDWGDVDGVFIAEPEVSSLRATLVEARARLLRGWSDKDRDVLSGRASQNFAWSHLAPHYVNAYRACLSEPVESSKA
jgi:glycosyltransferase involved in cell wall biosynthesis